MSTDGTSPDISQFFGWHDDYEKRERTRADAGIFSLSQVAPGLMAGDDSGDVMLYKAWKDVLGDYPDYSAQQIGDCESFGHGHANDLMQCINLVISGKDAGKAYRETCTEALYAAGREAGNMLGGGDGCYGSAMVTAMRDLGMVPREIVGPYSGQRAKQWGRTGMPAEIRKAAAEHRIKASALVTTVSEAKAAIKAGYVISLSSDQGFEGNGGFRRDAKGICYAGGTWNHCMFLGGKIDSDGVDTGVICQSWGNEMPGGPRPFDLPPFAFRGLWSTIARMLAQRDSYIISEAAHFVAKPLPASWTNTGWAA